MSTDVVYQKWATDQGVVAPHVRVARFPAPLERGLVCASSAPPRATLLSVPIAATLSVMTLSTWPIASTIRALEAAKGEDLREDDRLALLLIHERWVAGPGSAWAPHIARLPRVVDSPFSFTVEELAAAVGSSLAPIAEQMQRQAQDDHAVLTHLLAHCADPSSAPLLKACTLSAYKWAVSIVWSRFLSLPLDPRAAPVKTMVPFLDFANHDPGPGAAHHRYDAATRTVVVEAGPRGIDAGTQLCIHYGPLPPRTLLQLHGFVLPVQPAAAEGAGEALWASDQAWHPFPVTVPILPSPAAPPAPPAHLLALPRTTVHDALTAVLRGPPALLPPGAPGGTLSTQGRTSPAGSAGSAIMVELALHPGAPHAFLLPVGRVLYAAHKEPAGARAVLLRLIASAPHAPLPSPHEGLVVAMLLRSVRDLVRRLPARASERLAALEATAAAAAAAAQAFARGAIGETEASGEPAGSGGASATTALEAPSEAPSAADSALDAAAPPSDPYRLGCIAAVVEVERAALTSQLQALRELAAGLGLSTESDEEE